MSEFEKNDTERTAAGELTPEELDQVSAGSIFSDISAAALLREQITKQIQNNVLENAKTGTTTGPLYHYLTD